MRTIGFAPLALLVGGAATVANGCYLRASANKVLVAPHAPELADQMAETNKIEHGRLVKSYAPRDIERHGKVRSQTTHKSRMERIKEEKEARHLVAMNNLAQECNSEMTKYNCRIGFKPARCLQKRSPSLSEECKVALRLWFMGEPTREMEFMTGKADEDRTTKSFGENFNLGQGPIESVETLEGRMQLHDLIQVGMGIPVHHGEGPHETPRRGHSQHHGGPPPQHREGPPPQHHEGPPPQHHGGPPPQHHEGPPPRHHGGPPPRHHEGPPPRHHGGPPPPHHGHHRGEDMVIGRPPRSTFSVLMDWISGVDSESSDSSDESSDSSPSMDGSSAVSRSIDTSSDSSDSSEADDLGVFNIGMWHPVSRAVSPEKLENEKWLANVAHEDWILSRRDQDSRHHDRFHRDRFQHGHDGPLAEILLMNPMADEVSSSTGAVSNTEADFASHQRLQDPTYHHVLGYGREHGGGRFHENSHHDHLRYRNQLPDDFEESSWFEDSFDGDMDCDFLQGLLAFFFFVGAITIVVMPFVLFARALKEMVRGHIHRDSASFSTPPGPSSFAFGGFARRSNAAEAAAPEGYQPLPEEASLNTQDSDDDEAIVVTGTPVNPPPTVNI